MVGASEPGLVRFIDRQTIEYVRIYPHPVERVWRAITDPVEFGTWFIKGAIDLREGGTYALEGEWKGVILALDPPRRIRFDNSSNHGAGSWYQYELNPVAGGAQMVFTQYCPPGFVVPDLPSYDGLTRDQLPGGVDTPWYAGGLGGWHAFWEALGDYLDGLPKSPHGRERWRELTGLYIDHIRTTIPPPVSARTA
jgi:uncharacterized protein YndB with AHSA1/START domain